VHLVIDVNRSPEGRLIGFAAADGGPTALPFSGIMELVACVEELCQADAGPPEVGHPGWTTPGLAQ